MNSKVELFAENAKKSAQFYQDFFNFKIVRENGEYISLQNDNTKLAINAIRSLSKDHYFRPEIKIQRKGLGVEIVFEVERIDEVYALFKDYPIESTLKKQSWGKKDFRVKDPDGYYIRVTTQS